MKNFFYLLLLGFFFSSCGNDDDNLGVSENSPLVTGFPEITITMYASGFQSPVAIVNAGDGSKRLFVVEQSGIIKVIENGKLSATPFLNISSQVKNGGEQGLLGLAFPPDFSSKNYFYVNYTNRVGVGNTIIARYQVDTHSRMAINSSGRTILTIEQPYTNHNGGHMAFGPDSFLYIATGDGGSAGDPFKNAQNTSSLLGKILRIDVERSDSYTVPNGNPFGNEVWVYGLRNPWRFSFDKVTNDIFIADVGQNKTEEINFLAAGANAVNFGWNIMEGSECYQDENCNKTALILPVAQYRQGNGDCSVIGGYVYRGTEFPSLYGAYLFGDYCSGKIRGLKSSNEAWLSQELLDTDFNISSFGEDEDGNIYFADIDSGNIYKITVKQ